MLLTYNVAGLPEGLSGSNPEANAPRVGELIDAYDLVVLQEDFGFYSDTIEAGTTHPSVSPLHPGPDEVNPLDRQEALVGDGLRRYSRFPFLDHRRQPWTTCFGGVDTSDGGAADCLGLKGYSVASTELGPGVVVDVYNLHVEAGNTDADLRAAELDLVELADAIGTQSAGRAVIVAGDWNLHPDRAPEAALLDDFRLATGLVDACEVVDCGADGNEIDRVMFRAAADVELSPVSHSFARAMFVDDEGEPLSDHDPLVVEFVVTMG